MLQQRGLGRAKFKSKGRRLTLLLNKPIARPPQGARPCTATMEGPPENIPLDSGGWSQAAQEVSETGGRDPLALLFRPLRVTLLSAACLHWRD